MRFVLFDFFFFWKVVKTSLCTKYVLFREEKRNELRLKRKSQMMNDTSEKPDSAVKVDKKSVVANENELTKKRDKKRKKNS